MDIEEDLLSLFLQHKIDKENLKKLLKIHKIDYSFFNKRVIQTIYDLKEVKRPVLKVDELLDNKFKKEILDLKANKTNTPIQNTFLLDKDIDLKQVFKNKNLLTYKSAKRLLNVEELVCKGKEYCRALGIDINIEEEAMTYFSKSLEFFLKNTFDKCGNEIDLKKVKEVLKDHLGFLNLRNFL